MRVSLVVGTLLVAIALLVYSTARADYADREDVRVYVDALVADHGFERAWVEDVLGKARRQQSIIDAISRPAEKVLKWHEYRRIFIEDRRIERGLEFWNEHRQALERAEAEYGVPAHYIVAIIGVETRYGRILGGYRVLDALATLGFDYEPRAKFFRKELTEFLLLSQEERRDPTELKGSYAGAMGYGQFIPSSYRSYAVDFDGDGQRDIWSNPVDAIGSVANYFKRHGWRGDSAVIELASMPADDEARKQLDALANQSLKPEMPVGQLRELGLFVADVPNEARAALFRMEQPETSEYWLGLHDFYVISRYNHSRMYALVVYQLGQLLAASQGSARLEAS
ncbi:MAG: lytic murein transglycosylase B [Pseudomonadota bacterium]